ncbi:MAG TPA: hypothetical protein VLF93_05970 [Candidatus Saccharimonadales bacterium]|nr:hypothetical protein [Candidatus Saccharimonadales bacterium]
MVIFSISSAFIPDFNLGVDFIIVGTYAKPPSDYFSFGGGYGHCGDLMTCVYLPKEEFVLAIIAIQLVSYFFLVLLLHFLKKRQVFDRRNIQINGSIYLLALVITIMPFIVGYYIAATDKNLAYYSNFLELNNDPISLLESFLWLIVLPFVVFSVSLLSFSSLSHKLGLFKFKNNNIALTSSQKTIAWLLLVLTFMVFSSTAVWIYMIGIIGAINFG